MGRDGAAGGDGISGTTNLLKILMTCAGVVMADGDKAGWIGGRAPGVGPCWDGRDYGLSNIIVHKT